MKLSTMFCIDPAPGNNRDAIGYSLTHTLFLKVTEHRWTFCTRKAFISFFRALSVYLFAFLFVEKYRAHWRAGKNDNSG